MKSFTVATVLAVASAPIALASESTFKFYNNLTEAKRESPDATCILFSNDEDTPWYSTISGSWGSGSTTGTDFGYFCSNKGSGAMFIGKEPMPESGSTKLECNYPTDGSGQVYCDISLVDGYSVAVQCTAGSVNIGGSTALFETGVPCPDKSGNDCINTEGYAPSQSDVAPFFQQGVENGNNYCIWHNCPNPNFPDTEQLQCTIYSP